MITFEQFCIEEAIAPSNESMIERGIERKVYMRFYYSGDKNIERGYRTVRPAALGLNKKGDGLFRAFQVMGPSKSGKSNPWRLFRTDKMDDITTSTKKFKSPGKGYNPSGDKTMASVTVNVKV